MRSRSESVVAVLIVILTAMLMLAACSKQDPGVVRQNIPPETTLSFVSDTGDTTELRVHLTWLGSDPDGEVVAYLARWDTLDWFSVSGTDSVFALTATDSRDSAASYGVHTFSVKSIDNDGDEDATPATLTFTARNTFPETEIIHGPGSVTSPMVCIEWRGWDNDGVVVGYGLRLYTDQGGEWLEVAGEDSLPPDEFTIQLGPMAGLHRFEVWSIDDTGALDPTPAALEFTCNPAFPGPILLIRTNVLGNHGFLWPEWPPAYDIPIDIFEGEKLVFDWYADNENYSSCPILGFSYAFDDTSAWCQSYSMDDTHFEVTPEVGEHSLYVAVLGAAGVATRARIALNVVETSLDDYILVVDDYDKWELNPTWGTDADRDAFYDTLTAGYAHAPLQWDPAEHVVEGTPQPPDVSALAGASTVVWYCDESDVTLAALFNPIYADYSVLSGYVRSGGNLVLCGYKVIGQMLQEAYPITIAASDSTLGRVFVRDFVRVGQAQNTGAGANPASPWYYGYCFYGAVPGGTGIPGGRDVDLEPMYIDSVGAGGYPEPGKWFPYADPPLPQYSRCGLGNIDVFEPYDGHPIETHGMDAFLNMNFEGRTCVLLSPTGEGSGNVCCLGFPLYYLQTQQVKAFFDQLLPLFGEERL
jgi:hypothetical protein